MRARPIAEDMRVPGYQAIADPDAEEGGFVVTCPDLQGCYSQETREEALANIEEAMLNFANAQNINVYRLIGNNLVLL